MVERPKIGELLVAAGVIDEPVLEAALEKQRTGGGRIGRILIGMGALDEEMLVRTVARQLDMPVAWLRGKQVKAEVLSLLPAHIARRHRCLPVMLDRKGPETLLVAMEDPSDAAALDDVALAAGRSVRVVLAAPSELEDAIERHYPAPVADDEDHDAPPPSHAEPERQPDPDPEPDPETDPEPGDDEPELLLTDPLGETGSAEPSLRRVAHDETPVAQDDTPVAARAEVDPLDLGGDYDPLARADIDSDLGEEADLEVDPEPANLEPGPELGLSQELAPGEDLGLDIAPDRDSDSPAPREREFAERNGDSLDDAIGEVRGAYGADDDDSARESGGAGAEEGVSLFGDDPLEVTLPPRSLHAQPDALPRDPELRAVVLLLIERGLLTREEVSERLLSRGRDEDQGG
ncbi:MAG TPA: hypothetical protein VNF72_20675 [Myxococcota bacterium]|nr:hypothetical protein [Myxococcota bacterium]